MGNVATASLKTSDDTRDKKSKERKERISRLIWGRSLELEMPIRVAMLAFVIAGIASISFSQLGFWSIGLIDSKPVYLMLILAPLVMGSFAFGIATGALLGLYAGAVVFIHALVLPLDYYEVYFMTILNTFVLLTVFGAAASWLFGRLLRSEPQGGKRSAIIVGTCLVLSFATSALTLLNAVINYSSPFGMDLNQVELVFEYLLCSPLGFAVQALIDAALMALLCWAVDLVIRTIKQRGSDRTLLSMFSIWMLVVSSIVFMIASAGIFSLATLSAESAANTNMRGELQYLKTQMELQPDEEPEDLLDGYTMEEDGTVLILDEEGTVLASDDPSFAKGSSLWRLLGYDSSGGDSEEASSEGAGEGSAAASGEGAGESSEENLEEDDSFDGREMMQLLYETTAEKPDESFTVQGVDSEGVSTFDPLFVAIDAYDGGYLAILRPPSMVFANRFGVMASTALLAFLLIAAIGIMASQLLKQVVIRRIDETNDSLEKITGGDLNERVRVRDSREFASLSDGINTTVAALKDSIAEAEQKNAQELLAAKAIQENALPREFPPFPEIDRFDIYASMKTAKEVGGDFYDFFLIDNDKLGFIMADVSGKGIPAALFMMAAKTQIRNYMNAGLPVGEAVDAANHQLCIGNDSGMFVTMLACELNYQTGELHYVNAGHNPPLILRDGVWEWVRGVSGMPLGLFDGIGYDSFTRQLAEGDMLYLYTDGVTEAMDKNDNLFGEERLEETLYEYATMNPRSVGVGVRRALTDFTMDAEQSDDITMLVLKYGVPPERKAVMILPAVDTQLVHVCNFIHEELHRRGAPKSVRNPLDIAAEELFVNVCHYAYPDATPENPGEVRISFEYEANPPSLTVELADDGIPYNPLAKPDAVTPDDIMDVPIGGLGILMAKNSVDEMDYRREGDSNILTFKKGW